MNAAALPFAGDDRLRRAVPTGARWLDQVALWCPNDPDRLTTGAHETAVILLGGTFDLVGGGTAWPARGARQDAFAGRPMAVFLPPHTTFQVSNGRGEILLLAARQPTGRDEPTGREALASKPLLPLAGSGKAFDPTKGEWMPAETFPSAPESLPPRRFQRFDVPTQGGAAATAVVERIFAPDYKAATLSVDEVVLQPGQSLALRDVPARPNCDEMLLFVRTEDQALVGDRTQVTNVRNDVVLRLTPAEFDAHNVGAAAGRAYLAIAYAGKR